MSVRNLDKLFKPRSVALIGATDRAGSVGTVLLRNLRKPGFTGELLLVNPRRQTLDGLPVYPDVASLPRAPDLAVIVTPAGCAGRPSASRLARRCAERTSSRGSSRRIVPAPTRMASAAARSASTRSRSAAPDSTSLLSAALSRHPSSEIAQLSTT